VEEKTELKVVELENTDDEKEENEI